MAGAVLKTMGEDLWEDAPAAQDDRAPEAAIYPFAAATAAPESGIAGMVAQLLSTVRKHQKRHFPGVLGSESCWAVLLQLYAAHVYQHRLHIQALTERSGVPGTTVLRALEALIGAGFVSRSEDRFDRRRVVVELTASGAAAMNDCLLNSGSRCKLF